MTTAAAEESLSQLVTDCTAATAHLLASSTIVASLVADLGVRAHASHTAAVRRTAAVVSALRAPSGLRVHAAKHRFAVQTKLLDAAGEALSVSVKQLRLWSRVLAGLLALADSDRGGVMRSVNMHTGLLAEPCCVGPAMASALAQSPAAVGKGVLLLCSAYARWFCTGVGRVLAVPAETLLARLMCCPAAEPGTEPSFPLFQPGVVNHLCLEVLSEGVEVADWLQDGDGAITATPANAAVAAVGQAPRTSLPKRHGIEVCDTPQDRPLAGLSDFSVRVHDGGVLTVSYHCSADDVLNAVDMQLWVCGFAVVVDGAPSWRVHRRGGAHNCVAAGTYVSSLCVRRATVFGMCVSPDEKWVVLADKTTGTLFVCSLPGCELVRSFEADLKAPCRMCFAPDGSRLLVADHSNSRLQELTLEGTRVRCIGEGQFQDGLPFGVAVHADLIAVCCMGGFQDLPVPSRLVLLSYTSGLVLARYGTVGFAPGQLASLCSSVRFTHDGEHVLVAECDNRRVSVFTRGGVFERCLGVGVLRGGMNDVELSARGEVIVADVHRHRVCVLAPNGDSVLRAWGTPGSRQDQFDHPCALAAAGLHLYVADRDTGTLRVFM